MNLQSSATAVTDPLGHTPTLSPMDTSRQSVAHRESPRQNTSDAYTLGGQAFRSPLRAVGNTTQFAYEYDSVDLVESRSIGRSVLRFVMLAGRLVSVTDRLGHYEVRL